MSSSWPHGVDEEKLAKWLESGVEEEENGEACCFSAGKRVKERSCKRHGGLLPPLRRSAGGRCPVRVEVHSPVALPASGRVGVIIVLRGVHSHVHPVCMLSSQIAHKIIGDIPSCLSAHFSYAVTYRFLIYCSWDFFFCTSLTAPRFWSFFVIVFLNSTERRRRCERGSSGQQRFRAPAAPTGADGRASIRAGPAGGHGCAAPKRVRTPVCESCRGPGRCYRVILQNEDQARLSGKVRYCEADSKFGVVAPGAAKDGVSADAIATAGKQAFDWNHISIVYVPSGTSDGGQISMARRARVLCAYFCGQSRPR